jgi:hypothetical protein
MRINKVVDEFGEAAFAGEYGIDSWSLTRDGRL